MNVVSRWTQVVGTLGLCLVLMTACKLPEKSGEDAESPVVALDAPPADTQPALKNQAGLVQVLIYGLAAWEFVPELKEKPDEVHVHLPKVPKHTADLMWGDQSSGTPGAWKPLRDDDGFAVDIEGQSLSFDFGGQLEAFYSGTVPGDYPATAEEAADVRWIFEATDFESIGNTPGNDYDYSNHTTTHVTFEGGTLETCGLVHSEKDIHEICSVEVKVSGSSSSASEYMVLRYPVTNVSTISVHVGGDSYEIQPTGGAPVTWNTKKYTQVFDVRIRNATKPDKRDMSSDHANHLKGFFPKAMEQWDLWSPDYKAGVCRSRTTTPAAYQPDCLQYFGDSYKTGPGGTKRPICPFVEHP